VGATVIAVLVGGAVGALCGFVGGAIVSGRMYEQDRRDAEQGERMCLCGHQARRHILGWGQCTCGQCLKFKPSRSQ